MFELSYTKAHTYLNCPWLYKLKFLDNWKAPPSPHAALGLSIHKALEIFHKRRLKTLEELCDCLDKVWERVGYRDAEEELVFYDKAKLILKTYLEKVASRWDGEVLELEKKFFLDLPAIGIKLQGIIDRVDRMPDGSFAVVDYKTHAEPWSQERLKGDLQITLYQKAARESLGLLDIRLYFFFVAQGTLVEVTRQGEDWATAEKALVEVKQKVEGGQFTPNTNHCQYCEMKKSCKYSICK